MEEEFSIIMVRPGRCDLSRVFEIGDYLLAYPDHVLALDRAIGNSGFACYREFGSPILQLLLQFPASLLKTPQQLLHG